MAWKYGTDHFVSKSKAARYYYSQGYGESYAEAAFIVAQKLANREIAIGPPALPANGKLVLLDSGTRYGIEE